MGANPQIPSKIAQVVRNWEMNFAHRKTPETRVVTGVFAFLGQSQKRFSKNIWPNCRKGPKFAGCNTPENRATTGILAVCTDGFDISVTFP